MAVVVVVMMILTKIVSSYYIIFMVSDVKDKKSFDGLDTMCIRFRSDKEKKKKSEQSDSPAREIQ